MKSRGYLEEHGTHNMNDSSESSGSPGRKKFFKKIFVEAELTLTPTQKALLELTEEIAEAHGFNSLHSFLSGEPYCISIRSQDSIQVFQKKYFEEKQS